MQSRGAELNNYRLRIDNCQLELQLLARRAVIEYTPLVESLLRGGSRDVDQIEQTLDGLLGFCFDDDALALYKRICRHYLSLNPEATAAYVYAYRDMWATKGEEQA